MDALKLMEEAQAKGVVFSVDDGELTIEAEKSQSHWPKKLRPHKRAIIAALTGEDISGEPEALAPGVPKFEPFPTDALPEPLREFVEWGAKSIGCDPSFVALPALAACAGAIGATRVIRLKRGWREPAILWCVVVAPSGSVKSEGGKLVLASLLKREKRMRKEYEEAMRLHGPLQQVFERDLSQWKRSKDGSLPPEPPEPPVLRETIIGDATVEGVARVLQNNPRGLLLERDELAAWLGSFDRYSSGKGDSQNWINMHGGGYVKVTRAGLAKPLLIDRACVSVSGTIQPGTLTALLGSEHRESGLAARLLFANPPRRQKRWTDAEIPERVANGFALAIGMLIALDFAEDTGEEHQPVALPLTNEAQKRLIAFVNRHGEEAMNRDGDQLAAWAKLEGYAARIALVLQLANDPDATAVSDESLASGIRLAEWFGNEADRFYSGARETPEQVERRLLAEWLTGRQPTTPAEIARSGPQKFRGKAEQVEVLMNTLASEGKGEWQNQPPGPSGGRPTRGFVVTNSEGNQWSGN